MHASEARVRRATGGGVSADGLENTADRGKTRSKFSWEGGTGFGEKRALCGLYDNSSI